MLPTTPDGSGTSTKVAVPSWVATLVAAIITLIGIAGVGLPPEVTDEWVLEVIGAGMFIVAAVTRVVGYYVRERNPSASAIEVVQARTSS